MSAINYLVVGLPLSVNVVRISVDDSVQSLLDLVHDRRKLDCGPDNLEAYFVNIPLTVGWKVAACWDNVRSPMVDTSCADKSPADGLEGSLQTRECDAKSRTIKFVFQHAWGAKGSRHHQATR